MRLSNWRIATIFLILLSVISLAYIYKPNWKTTDNVQTKDLSFILEQTEGTLPVLGEPITKNVNACILILTRNSDMFGIMSSIRQLEDRFNKRYNYPYVMLNNEPFSDEFKEKILTVTNSKVEFGLVPEEHWSYPSYVDQKKAAELRKKNKDAYVYGDSESYRHMCRFFSGFFFLHNLTLKYDYYWRVEPDVQFSCDINEDPFQRMVNSNAMYGFTMSLTEFYKTIPTLWSTTKEWMKTSTHGRSLPSNNSAQFISSTFGLTYNTCHFWSNFEIGNFKLWRSKAYLDYFDFLDRSGGFFYERWGDAPVHSIYASLALSPSQMIYFENIGYFHSGHQHCPQSLDSQTHCHCDPRNDFNSLSLSCINRWKSLYL